MVADVSVGCSASLDEVEILFSLFFFSFSFPSSFVFLLSPRTAGLDKCCVFLCVTASARCSNDRRDEVSRSGRHYHMTKNGTQPVFFLVIFFFSLLRFVNRALSSNTITSVSDSTALSRTKAVQRMRGVPTRCYLLVPARWNFFSASYIVTAHTTGRRGMGARAEGGLARRKRR